MFTSYATILRRPGALAFSAAGLLARFPMSMVGISTILAVQALYGSYSAAGSVSAANIVAAAVGAPVLARLVDAHGQARIMFPAVSASAASLLALVVAATLHAPLTVLMVLAALAGGLGGSMGSLVRSRWTTLLDDTPEQIHTAFSLEAAADELVFVVGPVLATALSTSPVLPVTSGWILSLTLQITGGLWFLSQRGTEPPSQHARQDAAGSAGGTRPARPVLVIGTVLAVVIIFTFIGSMLGANDVAVVSFATERGRASMSGLILAAWAVGSLTAALLYGLRSWRWPLWKQFLAGTIALAVGTSTFVLAPNLVVMGMLMVLTGLAIAPTVTSGTNIVQQAVPPSQLTEGLAWISTALNLGVSLGSFAAGHVIDASGSHGGYLFVAGTAWVAVLVALAGTNVIRRSRPLGSLADQSPDSR